MNKKSLILVFILILMGLLLAACAGEPVEASAPEAAGGVAADALAPPEIADEAKPPAASDAPAFDTGSRTDGQGAVTIDVAPANLNSPIDTLDFNVMLNTHSVDLSMDFATLSSLTTDTGVTVNASTWNGASGGHHVSGVLSFPAAVDGTSVLDGASEVTLTIRNVDAPERVFFWKITR